MRRFIGIPAIAAVFVAWGVYTAGAGLLIERYLPDQKAFVAYAAKVPVKHLRPKRKQNCVPYDPYPDAVICQKRWMWHIQPGGWGFMGDLWQPHKSLPPLIPLDKRGNGSTQLGRAHPNLRDAIIPFAPRVTAVYCASIDGYAYTFPSTGEIYLNQYLCNPLDALVSGFKIKPKRQGAGLITLVHEAIHNKVNVSEAETECRAFQKVDDVLNLWNTPFPWRNEVLSYAYKDHLTFTRATPLYDSRKCREDGPWDMTPGDGQWP